MQQLKWPETNLRELQWWARGIKQLLHNQGVFSLVNGLRQLLAFAMHNGVKLAITSVATGSAL